MPLSQTSRWVLLWLLWPALLQLGLLPGRLGVLAPTHPGSSAEGSTQKSKHFLSPSSFPRGQSRVGSWGILLESVRGQDCLFLEGAATCVLSLNTPRAHVEKRVL